MMIQLLFIIRYFLLNSLLIPFRHVLFASPKVEDIVHLLIDKSKTVDVGKSDEQLLVEAIAFIKKAYYEVLGLEEGEVTEETDFFETLSEEDLQSFGQDINFASQASSDILWKGLTRASNAR